MPRDYHELIQELKALDTPAANDVLTWGTGRPVWSPASGGGLTSDHSTFRAQLPSNQSVNSAAFTRITYGTENFDVLSEYDNVTNYRFTPTTPGYYLVIASALWEDLTIGGSAAIYKNGAAGTEIGRQGGGSGSGNDKWQISVGLASMNGTTDYLEGFAYHATGIAKLIQAGSWTFFAAHKLSNL